MNRANRAAQFNPFDALKGLQEALREREEKLTREEKRELSEEQQAELSAVLSQIKRNKTVEITFYYNGRYYRHKGTVTDFSREYGYIVVDRIWIGIGEIFNVRVVY
ncbi:MAG TPA: YolD-like family protein [Clostridia bacterium]|nr:YolD-like family protein [Clostridia bacterium]